MRKAWMRVLCMWVSALLRDESVGWVGGLLEGKALASWLLLLVSVASSSSSFVGAIELSVVVAWDAVELVDLAPGEGRGLLEMMDSVSTSILTSPSVVTTLVPVLCADTMLLALVEDLNVS